MTQDLKAITASRDELNKEITERTVAEENIRATPNDLLFCLKQPINFLKQQSAADYKYALPQSDGTPRLSGFF